MKYSGIVIDTFLIALGTVIVARWLPAWCSPFVFFCGGVVFSKCYPWGEV